MNPARRAFATRLITLLLVTTALLVTSRAVAQPYQSITVNAADIVFDDGDRPPPDTARWTPQTLPDNWNLSRPGHGGFAWYRVTFDVPATPHAQLAILVRKLSMNAAFHVNGVLVGSGGRFSEPVARNWNRPQFHTIPGHLLVAGRNTLHVRLYAYPNARGGLGQIVIGAEDTLRPAYERRLFVQTVLPQLCNIVVAALGIFAFALWIRRRAEPTYVVFFVFSLLWALRSTHMFVRDIPVSADLWDVWVQSSFGWCALLFVVLAMRYSGVRWPRFEIGLLAYAVAGPALMLVAGPRHLHTVASNWSFVIVPLALFFEGFLVQAAWRQRTRVSALLATVWALIIVASVHDGLVHRDRLDFESFYVVSYAMILLSLVMGWILVDRFVQALNLAEKLNLELEMRVAEKHRELQANFARLRDLERDRAIGEERRRIMTEMHDGLGSQLIATLGLVEHGDSPNDAVAAELRECLDSLRLTVDSLEPSDTDLPGVLGNLRYRLEGRLRRQGIALDWRVTDLPSAVSLSPQQVLHILRILQEAFTNVIKHAGADTITVTTGSTADEVFVIVSDNGTGLTGERQGRGLTNMRARARALGATLELTGTATGTRVRLALPRRGASEQSE